MYFRSSAILRKDSGGVHFLFLIYFMVSPCVLVNLIQQIDQHIFLISLPTRVYPSRFEKSSLRARHRRRSEDGILGSSKCDIFSHDLTVAKILKKQPRRSCPRNLLGMLTRSRRCLVCYPIGIDNCF